MLDVVLVVRAVELEEETEAVVALAIVALHDNQESKGRLQI